MRNSPPVVFVALAVLASACAGDQKPAPTRDSTATSSTAQSVPAAATNVVNITAKDYTFDAPDTLPAGATTLRLTDRGKELHHVQLMRLAEGKSFEDLAKEKGDPPRWAVPVGGPNSPIPGGVTVSETSLQLDAGNYALICVIPSPDGKLHLMKGMARKLTVIPSSGKGALPETDLSVSLSDYAFGMPDSISAGKHHIRVQNSAPQPHEFFIAKLNDGKSPEDLAKWVEKMDGPPPATPIGGTTGLVPGIVNVVSVDLAPGNYGLFCFIPDAKDGKPHVAHGMLRKLKVT